MTYTVSKLHKRLQELTEDCTSILEVGCGKGDILQVLRGRGQRLVGVDVWMPYLEWAPHPDVTYIKASAEETPFMFPKHSFDAVLMIDFVEHLPKDAALKLMRDIEMVAKRIIIMTPEGFMKQEDDIWSYTANGLVNKAQFHLSGWNIEDFAGLEYKVEIMDGYHRTHPYSETKNALLAFKDFTTEVM